MSQAELIDAPHADQAHAAGTDQAQLEALARQVDANLDGAATAAPGQAPAPDLEADQAQQLEALLGLAVATLTPALPFLPSCYTPEALRQISVAGAAVCAKHGWTLDGLMSPELALAAVAIPPTVAAVVAGRAHYAAARAAAATSSAPSSLPAPAVRQALEPNPHAGERILPSA